jgi:nucleoside-diphosphate-sugar epimerase
MAETLLKDGAEVVIVDDLSNSTMENIAHIKENVKFYKSDVTDQKQLEEVFRKETADGKIDVVFHYAAIVGVERATKFPIPVLDSNIAGIRSVLEMARKFGVDKVMEASSSELYGDIENVPMPEDIPATPFSPYGVTKLVAEQYCKSFNEVYGLKTFIMRYFNVYGPRQDYKLRSWVMPNFIMKCLSNEQPVVYGDGSQTRDFTYITDAIAGTLMVMKSIGAKTDVFNVGTGVELSVLDLAKKIIEITGVNLQPAFKEKRKFDIKRRCADISKIGKLGFEPKVNLDEGLTKTIDWFRKNVHVES